LIRGDISQAEVAVYRAAHAVGHAVDDLGAVLRRIDGHPEGRWPKGPCATRTIRRRDIGLHLQRFFHRSEIKLKSRMRMLIVRNGVLKRSNNGSESDFQKTGWRQRRTCDPRCEARVLPARNAAPGLQRVSLKENCDDPHRSLGLPGQDVAE
jgi:hypothetical protein